MGKRGPKPKPKTLKELEGNPGKRALNDLAPQPIGRPICPAHLEPYAREVWDRIIGSMPEAVYTAAEQELLAAYCLAADMQRKAAIKIQEEGAVFVGPSGVPSQSPWVGILNTSAQRLATIGTRLGLDPTARSSIVVIPGDKPLSKFEGLFSIEGGRKE